MSGMDMGGMDMGAMPMSGMYGPYAMSREASGTAWQPEAARHEGVHLMKGAWMLMLHGFADGVYDHQGGHRGDKKAFSNNMGMAMAQRSLGAKAKVVWLSAGGREMVVAITPQNVRMLSQWDKQETAPLPRAQTVPPAESQQPASEAVAGILRLRARTNAPFHDAANANTLDGPRPRARTYQPEINEDVATGDDDADAVWAREILAATGGRR